LEESLRAPNPNGSGAANRPAQVFDVEIWNKLRQEASQSERIAAQAQDLTLIAICAYRQDIVNEGFSHGTISLPSRYVTKLLDQLGKPPPLYGSRDVMPMLWGHSFLWVSLFLQTLLHNKSPATVQLRTG